MTFRYIGINCYAIYQGRVVGSGKNRYEASIAARKALGWDHH